MSDAVTRRPRSPRAKAVRIIAILVLVYVGIIVAFESMLGYFQPGGQGTLVITTTDEDGTTNERVLSRLESNGQLYVAALAPPISLDSRLAKTAGPERKGRDGPEAEGEQGDRRS